MKFYKSGHPIHMREEDSAECDGRSLLKGFIKAAVLRNEPVHVLGFEVSEDELCTGLDSGTASRLVFHDGYSDPLQWLGQGKLSVQDYSAQNMRNRISQSDEPKVVTLVIDSLSWLLLHTPPTAVCQSLQELSRGGLKVKRVVALLHSDLHEQGVVGSVCHMATAVVTVTPVSGSVSAEAEPNGIVRTLLRRKTGRVSREGVVGSVCHMATAVVTVTPVSGSVSAEAEPNGIVRTLLRRKTGRVSREEEFYSVREDFSVQILRDLSTRKQPASDSRGETKQDDPAANLTFNLRLSEGERRARENLSLPFTFSEEKKSSLLQPRSGGGRILYEPDACDDFDQEDPDDDLDI
ncbi:UNVERIFIED_CONTAM: hypothetical protein FKN15_017497 [Acipenser sinensis]